MIAVDTSTWIAFLQGEGGEDAQLLDRAVEDRQVPNGSRCTTATDRDSDLAIGNGQASCERRCWQSAARHASAMP